ncbi:hypothetical protein LTS18_001366 [Coniosporium uncinatum]|uniref:Uncharacterized protein n=1 Tax=Coniosporium uncinatum TaxID=93489 RepID=A0ACC3DBQ6_9PEZI|nr:hypothetical protein LTS18_001366 [Coniosporium uncinatum]
MANDKKNEGPLLHQVMDIVAPGDTPAQRMQQIQAATMMQRTADPGAPNPVVTPTNIEALTKTIAGHTRSQPNAGTTPSSTGGISSTTSNPTATSGGGAQPPSSSVPIVYTPETQVHLGKANQNMQDQRKQASKHPFIAGPLAD